MRELYRSKGYSDEWIARRERGIAVRDTLTDEWKKRGIKEGKEYAILTAEISKATFGITPSQHKKIKSLDRPSENLRDHMTDLELLFTALGEASTTEIAKTHDVYGMTQNVSAAQAGGKIAGDARAALEAKTGRNVVSPSNYKDLPEAEVRKLIKANANEEK